jgi:hypothetical protein
MFDAAVLGDILMLGILVAVWGVAILCTAWAYDAVRKVIRGY